MKVIKTKVGRYRCPAGHSSEECLSLGDDIYCLPCFIGTVERRLAIPKVELVVPQPRPEPAEPEPEEPTEPEEPEEGEPEPPNEEGEGEAVEPEEGEEDDGREPGVPDDDGGEPATD